MVCNVNRRQGRVGWVLARGKTRSGFVVGVSKDNESLTEHPLSSAPRQKARAQQQRPSKIGVGLGHPRAKNKEQQRIARRQRNIVVLVNDPKRIPQ